MIASCLIPLCAFCGLENAVLICGNSNSDLAQAVAQHLNMEIGDALVSRFNDKEIRIRIDENIRNRDAYVIQSTCTSNGQSVNDHIMELYLMIRALKRASTNSITAIIPYYGYARQDRKAEPRVPISAADVALLIETAGADRVVAVDLHCGQIQGFFRNVPVDNLYASISFVPYFAHKDLKNVVVVSPDAGGVPRAKQFLNKLGAYNIKGDVAMIIKQRAGAGVIEQMNLVGNVKDADAIIVDDMCDTAGTLVKAAELIKASGARRVYAAITHPVFSGPALARIKESVIDEMVISDTIALAPGAPKNITQISIAPLLAETIRRLDSGKSVSELF